MTEWQTRGFKIQDARPDMFPIYCRQPADVMYYLMYVWEGQEVSIIGCKLEDIPQSE